MGARVLRALVLAKSQDSAMQSLTECRILIEPYVCPVSAPSNAPSLQHVMVLAPLRLVGGWMVRDKRSLEHVSLQ